MWRLLCKVLGGAVHRSRAGGGAGGEGRGLTGGSFHPESGAAWWADGEGRRAGPWGGCGAQRPLLLCRNKSPKEKGASSTNSSRARVDRVLAPRPQGGRWFGDSGRPSDRQERHWSCSRGSGHVLAARAPRGPGRRLGAPPPVARHGRCWFRVRSPLCSLCGALAAVGSGRSSPTRVLPGGGEGG